MGILGVAHNGNVYAAAVDIDDGYIHLCHSTNKTSWEQSTLSLSNRDFINILNFGTKFYAFLYNTRMNNYQCYTSEDAVTWTALGVYMNGVVVGSKLFIYKSNGSMYEVVNGTPTAVSTYSGIGLLGPQSVISAKSLCDYPIFIVDSYDDDSPGQLLVWYNGSSWQSYSLEAPDDGGYWYSGIASNDTIILASYLEEILQ